MINPEDFYRNLPTLTTKRLVLRKLTIDDMGDYYEFASDTAVTKYLRWEAHKTRSDTEKHLLSVVTSQEAGTDGVWGIELETDRRMVGIVHMMDLNARHTRGEIGFVVARDYWDRGIATEAVGCVLDCAFGLGLNRIQAYCRTDNLRGLKVLEKCGMPFEGTLRSLAYQKGSLRDFSVYSALSTDERPGSDLA
jgi:ribosomal-protein-alanine N-acetyltransferase